MGLEVVIDIVYLACGVATSLSIVRYVSSDLKRYGPHGSADYALLGFLGVVAVALWPAVFIVLSMVLVGRLFEWISRPR